MSEISKYEAYKKKLQGICDENNLLFRFRGDRYPITLTIKPVTGLDEQMSMLERAEENGYTSPDASIVFYFKDGAITYKTSQTFTISDTLFSKIKNLFKNLHYCWLQYFFRDIIDRRILSDSSMPVIDEADAYLEEAEPLESFEDDAEAEEEVSSFPFAEGYAGLPELDEQRLKEAARIVRGENRATTGLLQRSMNIGYTQAALLMDALEKLGVVGPFNGSQPREVLPHDEPEDPGDESGEAPEREG